MTVLTELTRAVLPGMLARRRGRVLLVGAAAGFAPGPGAAVFHATKAYVLSLGEALAYELRGSGVAVSTLCPGPTATGFPVASGGSYRDTEAMMESAAVAQKGYRTMKHRDRVWVPGMRNKIGAFLLRLAPRWLVLATMSRRLADRHDDQGQANAAG